MCPFISPTGNRYMVYTHRSILHNLICITTCCFLWLSCKKEADTSSVCSYSTIISPIINTKCAIPNCHNAASSLADFSTYEGLKQRADNGRIRTNVFDLKIMPPASAVQLTDDEKEKLKCWLDNGAPQD